MTLELRSDGTMPPQCLSRMRSTLEVDWQLMRTSSVAPMERWLGTLQTTGRIGVRSVSPASEE